MSLSRLIRYFNWSVGAALFIFLCLVYWFAYRVLPKTSGEVKVPISAAATIVRDENGVPHVKAETIEDVLFAQGYVHAQDRLWQMDALRRLAAGELSEVVGPLAFASDEEARRLRMRRIAEAELQRLIPEDRIALAAYARGVNAFIESHLSALPVEFTLLGYQPRPWSPVDSLLAGLQMFRDLTTTWKDDIAKAAMSQGDRAKADFLFPVRAGTEFSPGSNAWAVSGKLTKSGKPILANDPHLPWGIPSPWYLNHLQAPGLNVSGASLVGVPCVIAGHNDRIAWGLTNLQFDVQDLYLEKLDRQSGQYLYNGHVEQARAEREWIRIKNSRPVEFANWITRHGPLWNTGSSDAMSLRWMAAEPGSITFPFLQLNTANNWTEFSAGLQRFGGPGQNFVYADVDGNIAFHAAGRLPIRKATGDLPLDGTSGNSEWDGLIPFEELPSAYNPASGLIVSANQNPFPSDFKYRVNGNFAAPYRAGQIRSLLRAKAGWAAPEMLTVQTDVYSAFSHFLAGEITRAWSKQGSGRQELGPAVQILRGWNGQMDKELAAPLIVTLTYESLRERIATRAGGQAGAAYDFALSPSVVERLLRERPEGWFQNYDAEILLALASALERGRALQGRKVEDWRYGGYLELQIKNAVANRIPYLGPYFDIGPVPMSGSGTTIKQTSKRLGPSMRLVADAADWERSLQNLPYGESGQILSTHYKDQWDEYYVGKSLPMHFHSFQGTTLRLLPEKP